jgi:D-3-phosphoglycerate dehydrogenase / 2-oxoglutarate reductase
MCPLVEGGLQPARGFNPALRSASKIATKVTVLDDYHDTLRTLACFQELAARDVTVWNDRVQDVDPLAERLQDTEALVLIRERTQIRAPLLKRLTRAL